MPEVTVQPQQTTVEVQPDQMTVEVIGTPNTRTVFVESAVPGPPGPPGPSGLPDPGSNGIVVRTAPNTTAARSLAAGTNVSVTNGDGVSGNPTVNVPDASTTTKGAVELATDGESAAGLAVQANDSRLSNSRTPTAHASTHVTGGTDKIRDATSAQDGLMTAAYASKLDGIEAGADVTDATNVAAAITGSASKTTPVDTDVLPLVDSVLKKLTWANLKATLKTYFDALYPSGSGTSTGTNTGDQNLFGTIAVSGQSNVVADGTADTLTLVAGANVTITTDAATDSITIAAAGSGGGIGGSTGATDNAVLRADGTGGSTLQNSTMTIADNGQVVFNQSSNTSQALLIQGTDRAGYIGNTGYGNGIAVSDLVEITNGNGFTSTSSSGTVGHFMLRGDTDANVASLQNCAVDGKGTNPQTLRIYETYPSTGNYERLTISAASGTNVIKPEAAGTGSASKVDYHLTATDVRVTSGTGSPEGSVSAPVGSEYLRTDGGTGTTLYVKESGTGNTGWTAITNTGITQLTGDVTAGPGNGSQTATIADDAVTYAKMQNVSAASKLLGRGSASGSGDVEEITLGTGLSMSGTTLSATGGGTGDVDGPASATDEAVARFDSTTGKLIQNSVVTITDAGDIAGVNSIQMDTATPATLASQGQMAWNIDEETLDIQLNGFIMHTGEHLLYHVKNQTLSTIAKGTPVMFAGTDGSSGKLLIEPWNGTGPSTYFMGLTAEQLLNDEEGFVIAFGKLRGIQTNGGNYSQTWINGEIIYAGTTTGSLTDTAPAAPNPRIQVCAVVNAHPSNGTLFVRPAYGSNIKDDEGVTITSLTTGDLLIATSGGATGVFENKAMSGDATLASTGALSLASAAISGKTLKSSLAGTEEVLINDAGTLKKTTAQDIADLGGGGGSALRYAQLSSGVAITDNATFQNITGLSFSAAANTSYRIRFHMAVSASATSAGYEVGITGPASPTGYFAIVSLWNSATAETATITRSASYGSIGANANSGGGTARPCEGSILFHNGANAGTVQLQGKVENSVVGTVTFEDDSFMTWEEVTT
jgi:hypothetical protein